MGLRNQDFSLPGMTSMTSFARSSAALWLTAVIPFFTAPIVFAQAAEPDNPSQHWKQTDRWHLVVEYFGPPTRKAPEGAKPTATFPVDVKPADDPEDVPVGGWTILRFTPTDKAPERLRAPVFAWVLKGDGWLGGAGQLNPDSSVPVDKKLLQIGYVSIILEPDLSLPVEMLFPNLPPQKLTDPRTGTLFELRRQEKDDCILMEATFQIPGQDEIRLRQTWGKGDTWWRESTRYVNGRKIFHAQFASYHSTEKLEQQLREDINRFLEDDDRLDIEVNIDLDNPSPQEMLDAVQKATNVPLRVASELRQYATPLGRVHLRDCPAWAVLKFVASQGFPNAQWERDGNGYRLRPHGPLPAKPEQRRDVTPLLLLVGGMGLVLLLMWWVASWRRRAEEIHENKTTETP